VCERVSAVPVPVPPAPAAERSFPAAGIDRRFYAFALDHLIAWGIDLAVALAVAKLLISEGRVLEGVLLIVATMLLVGLVFAVMLGTTGSTPGKAFFGLRAVHFGTGAPMGVGPAIVRGLILGSAAVPFGFGLATLAWTAVADPTRMRRAWHDHVTGSIVVDVRPVPVAEEVDDAGPRHVVNLTAMRLVPARAQAAAPPDPARLPARANRPRPTPPPRTDDARESAERTTVRDAAMARELAVESLSPESPQPAWGLSFDTGDHVPVDTLVLIGRRPEARPGEQGARLVGLPSSDMSVSKTHAQVVIAPDGTLVVTDRGSTNGSVLVRQGVARPLTAGRPATLLEGDVVRVGDRQLTVVRLS
jgi:uncharacterized RDD family membrane protein YckC